MPFNLFQKKYFSAGSATDKGLKRSENQDALLCLPENGVFAVSDGMGGGDDGELAGRIVIQHLKAGTVSPVKDLSAIARLFYQANTEITAFAAKNNLRGMGATIAGIVLSPFHPDEAVLLFAGDSRCYRLRENELKILTSDHTIASAMGIAEGKLARHLQGVLTNVIGCGPNFFVEACPLHLLATDTYLLCSDGISRQVPEREIKRILNSKDSAEAKAAALVDRSLKYGGDDNATAIVLQLASFPEITLDIREEETNCPNTPELWKEDDDHVTPPTQ